MNSLEDYISFNHLKNKHDLNHFGIYGPSKQSVLVHLDNWVLKDVLFNNQIQNEIKNL